MAGHASQGQAALIDQPGEMIVQCCAVRFPGEALGAAAHIGLGRRMSEQVANGMSERA